MGANRGQFGKKGSGGGGGGGVTTFNARAGAVSPIEADYSTFYNLVPLTRTVAQMQTLAGAAGFQTGRGYRITGLAVAQAVTCSGFFIATSTSTISSTGWSYDFTSVATLTAVTVRLEYILATDEITEIYCPSSRNRITATSVNFAGLHSVPLDSATIQDNEVFSMGSGTIDPAANLTRSRFAGGASINMSAGSTFQGECGSGGSIALTGTSGFVGTIGDGAVYTGAGSSAFGGSIGVNSIVSLFRAAGPHAAGTVFCQESPQEHGA